MKSSAQITRWQEGPVDRSNEHMELRYSSTVDGGWDWWLPITLVGPPAGGVVNVEFLVDRPTRELGEIIAKVLQEIQYFLIENWVPDPWAYAQYHCHTMSNFYSWVHWSHFPPGTAPAVPCFVQTPDGPRPYRTPDGERDPRQDGTSVMTEQDLEFLWWLGRFVGTWRAGDATMDIGRGDDGYLEVRRGPGRRPKSLTTVLRDGVRIADPPGPLGPRPAVLTGVLAEAWLTLEDLRELWGALHSDVGLPRLGKRIELRIRDLDEPEQKKRWFWLWSHYGRVDPREHHDRCLKRLRAEFERATALGSSASSRG